MNEPQDDLRDDTLGARLESALGATPSQLSERLRALTSAGLRSDRPDRRPRPLWLELGPQLAGTSLLLAMLAAVAPWFLELVIHPARFVSRSPAFQLLTSPGAMAALMLPIGLLLAVEAMRGAPAVRRWLR